MKIGIAGLGLIGGSVAKALSQRTKGIEITAFDPDRNTISSALKDNVIGQGSYTKESILKNCDIIFLCMPVEKIISFIEKTGNTKAVFTDVGSTKADIMKSVPDNIRFVGGHPLTGSEKTGYKGSFPTLFENSVYVLCKGKNTSERDFSAIRELVVNLGALPLEMTAERHDETVAYISHIPHVAAAAICNTVSELNSDTAVRLCAGGFKDITRIASSSPSLWRDILLSGGDYVVNALDSLIKNLEEMKKSLINKDETKIINGLNAAKVFRDSISDNIGGMLPSVHEIWVEVPDKPGIIGTIASDLGKENINIKNIMIQNNRDFEGGCLRIGLTTGVEAKRAVQSLINKGYPAGEK